MSARRVLEEDMTGRFRVEKRRADDALLCGL